MKERPILFQGEMVRAILEGRKTMTRRVIKLAEFKECNDVPGSDWYFRSKSGIWSDVSTAQLIAKYCPFGQVGDRLWVRETWKCEELNTGLDGVRYQADNAFVSIQNSIEASDLWGEAYREGNQWRPSIFMPRWASRINLEITKVRVERVQDISEADAKAEGVDFLFDKEKCDTLAGIQGTEPEEHGYMNYLWHGLVHRGITASQSDAWTHQYSNYDDARGSFSSLWEKINAGRGFGWNVNPWVWVIEFKQVTE